MKKSKSNKPDKVTVKILQEDAERELDIGRFGGTVSVETFTKKPHFAGGIDTATLTKIGLQYNPDYEKVHEGKSRLVMRDITRHEINHKGADGFVGCPKTTDNHVDYFMTPIISVLSKKGFSSNDAHYAANALEDTILNNDYSRKYSYDGMAWFFDDVGANTEKKKFTEFYEAHTKLNMYLWGSHKQKKMMLQYYNNTDDVKQVLENFLKRTGISSMKYTYAGDKNNVGETVKDSTAIRNYLNNISNWANIAKIYAEEFSKLMKPSYAQQLPDNSGSGTKGRESEGEGQGNSQESDEKDDKGDSKEESDGDSDDDGENSDDNSDDEPQKSVAPKDGNIFDKEMYSDKFKRDRIKKAHMNNEGIPNWMNKYEALDLLYQSMAQKLTIKAESFTNSTKMPEFWYGKKPFDPYRDQFKQIKMGFSEDGKIELKKSIYHKDRPLAYKVSPRGFPEMRFCMLDTSGSMKSSPEGDDNIGQNKIIPWGDNSRYHYALLGWYGLLEYLKENHLLKQTNISLANFGSSTNLEHGLEKAKRLALTPQFGTTTLDLEEITEMFSKNDMLMFTISDGGLSNWGSIKNEFIKQAKKHHYFHLQIGESDTMTEDLEKNGLKVVYINNCRDLGQTVIDITDKLYRG